MNESNEGYYRKGFCRKFDEYLEEHGGEGLSEELLPGEEKGDYKKFLIEHKSKEVADDLRYSGFIWQVINEASKGLPDMSYDSVEDYINFNTGLYYQTARYLLEYKEEFEEWLKEKAQDEAAFEQRLKDEDEMYGVCNCGRGK